MYSLVSVKMRATCSWSEIFSPEKVTILHQVGPTRHILPGW